MQFFSTFLSLASLAAIASAQTPFPVMTRSVPASIGSKIESDVSSYIVSLYDAPAWTSASMALATELPDVAEDSDVNGDPVSLAEIFLTASATPTWFTMLPSDIQGFVSSVAAAQATIVQKDSAATPNTEVWMFGVVLAAGAAGMLLL